MTTKDLNKPGKIAKEKSAKAKTSAAKETVLQPKAPVMTKHLKNLTEQLIERLNGTKGFSSDVIPYGLPGVTIIDICDKNGLRIAKLSVSTLEELHRAEKAADMIIKLYNSRKCQILAASSAVNCVAIQNNANEVQIFNLNTDNGQRYFKRFVNNAQLKTAPNRNQSTAQRHAAEKQNEAEAEIPRLRSHTPA